MMRRRKPSGRKLPDKGQTIQNRPVDSRDKYPEFLIVCEGEKTEPNYFKGFRLNIKVTVIGSGFNTETLVTHTQELKKKAEAEKRPYKAIWVVFDKDEFPADDFNNAILKAKEAGFNVAYSNEAFELWYILHFDYMNNGVSRTQYEEMLSKRLGKPYKKNNPLMYLLLQKVRTQHIGQHAAIQNAEKLLKFYNTKHNPANDNPCTTVHQLVLELNKHLI